MNISKNRLVEEMICNQTGLKNAVLTTSGSKAVECCLANSDVKKGTFVVVPVTICKSVVDVILSYGCYPLFCDVDNELCLDINALKNTNNVEISCVIYAHQYGLVKDISPLVEYCKKNDYTLIEDSAQYYCCNKEYQKRAQGDYIVFSFGEGKPISAGKYGAVASNKKIFAKTENVECDDCIKKLIKKLKHSKKILLKKAKLVDLYVKQIKANQNLCLNDNFVDNIHHRLLFKQNHDYQKISDEMYKFMSKSNISNFQSTIVIEAFREKDLLNYKPVTENQNLSLENFPTYKRLKTSIYYFRTHDKITKRSVYKICRYFNEITSEKSI